MKTKTLLSVLVLGFTISAFGQNATMELTFTAEDNGQNIPLNSILIENLTQGGDTTLYAPDTVLVLDYLTSTNDIEIMGDDIFFISQNYPNHFKGKTEVDLLLPENEHVKIIVRDILGGELAQFENTLNHGRHSFTFYAGSQKYYLLTVTGEQSSKTIKMYNANIYTQHAKTCKIVYSGYEDNMIGYKSQNEINSFGFELGDELKYTCYSNIGERTITDSSSGNQTYTFSLQPVPESQPLPIFMTTHTTRYK